MDVRELKEYIYNNQYIEQILTSIGCHHIKHKDGYYQCANKDGDNNTAICVYENEAITTVNYTRQIIKGARATDLIDLVCYNEDLSFPEGLKFICNEIGLSYYHDFDEDIPDSFKYLKMIEEMDSNYEEDYDKPLKPIDESVLNYYKPYVNDMFANDGIDYQTQRDFNIGYDPETNRITIPIHSEIGDLVGVKGRIFSETLDSFDTKYLYLIQCNKSRLLFGLNKAMPYIKRQKIVYVFESEKAVMQCWSIGIRNAVATGGKSISRHQIELLTRLGAKIVFCYDKDVTQTELEAIAERFIDGINIYAIIDKDNILGEKESPSDNSEKMMQLIENNIYLIRQGGNE